MTDNVENQVLEHLRAMLGKVSGPGRLERRLDGSGQPGRPVIAQWQSRARVDVSTTLQVENIAEALSRKGVKAMDSLHVASAIAANAAYFLTTNKALLRKMAGHNQIRVVDPIDFVRILTGDFDEN